MICVNFCGNRGWHDITNVFSMYVKREIEPLLFTGMLKKVGLTTHWTHRATRPGPGLAWLLFLAPTNL